MGKARTQAQKLRQKRGRPRDDGVIYREPNGRASRAQEPADKVALEARARHLGLTVIAAKDQRAATFIGYLAMLGPIDGISETQYAAAQDYLDLRAAYLRSKQAPGAEYDGEGKGSGSEYVSPEYEEWCVSVGEEYDACRKAIMEAQGENRRDNLYAALDLCLHQGQHIHSLIGSTRILCNSLAKFFRRS